MDIIGRWAMFLGIFLGTCASLMAQDSLDYETQRRKVNDLLKDRSERFGQFYESLDSRSGIFGGKTKRDMQKSIDILKQIVLNDNKILKETQTLVKYKDQEKSLINQVAQESSGQIDNYVSAISKLQKYRESQNLEIEALKKQAQRNLNLFLVSLFALFLLLFIMWQRKDKKR